MNIDGIDIEKGDEFYCSALKSRETNRNYSEIKQQQQKTFAT